jgi:hypothetical protein
MALQHMRVVHNVAKATAKQHHANTNKLAKVVTKACFTIYVYTL